MKIRKLGRLRMAAVVITLLAVTTPAWAGLAFDGFCVYLEGVDRYGCLTPCGGQCATFCAIINTCTGEFAGSAKACVQNKSCRPECYPCVNFFCDPCIRVSFSLYTVSRGGAACYVAFGCLGNSVPG